MPNELMLGNTSRISVQSIVTDTAQEAMHFGRSDP